MKPSGPILADDVGPPIIADFRKNTEPCTEFDKPWFPNEILNLFISEKRTLNFF